MCRACRLLRVGVCVDRHVQISRGAELSETEEGGCSVCWSVYQLKHFYCSKECQEGDWGRHRKLHKMLKALKGIDTARNEAASILAELSKNAIVDEELWLKTAGVMETLVSLAKAKESTDSQRDEAAICLGNLVAKGGRMGGALTLARLANLKKDTKNPGLVTSDNCRIGIMQVEWSARRSSIMHRWGDKPGGGDQGKDEAGGVAAHVRPAIRPISRTEGTISICMNTIRGILSLKCLRHLVLCAHRAAGGSALNIH